MRARRLGTSLHVADARAAPSRARSKRASWSFWMSMKKKLGASAGSCSRICARILPSISATAASVDRPSPTETSISGVALPGRCRLASPSRAHGAGGARRRARPASISDHAAEPEQHQRAQRGGAEPQREARGRSAVDARSARPAPAASAAFTAEQRPRRPARAPAAARRGTAPRPGCAPRGRAATARRPAAVSSP